MQNSILGKKTDSFSKISKIFGKIPSARGNMMAAEAKKNKEEDTAAELYDVDRWREAEQEAQWDRDITGTSGSNIEQVKRKWNRIDDPDVMPDMFASHSDDPISNGEKAGYDPRSNSVYARINKDQLTNKTEISSDSAVSFEKNYLGLSIHAGIDAFFSSNPINSCLLAGDSLSMGCLSMDQAFAQSHVDSQDTNIEQYNIAPAETDKAINDSYMQKRREESMKKRDDIKIL